VLPYLEQGRLLEHGFELHLRPYDHPNNLVLQQHIEVYSCPSDNALGRMFENPFYPWRNSRSNLVVCWGSGIWAPNCPSFSDMFTSNNCRGEQLENDGPFCVEIPRRLSKITDGTSNTAMASEILSGQHDTYDGTPQGSDYRGLWGIAYSGMGSYMHRDTPNSSVGDALYSTHCVPQPEMPCGTPVEDAVLHHAAARSHHPGGVNVVSIDGHVDFYDDEIDADIWRWLATIEGGEVGVVAK